MKARKGMTLAGGADTRRHPMAMAMSTSKQRMPAYDKPTIHFPLATLMHAKTREILIISSGQDLPLFRQLPGDGGPGDISLHYAATGLCFYGRPACDIAAGLENPVGPLRQAGCGKYLLQLLNDSVLK